MSKRKGVLALYGNAQPKTLTRHAGSAYAEVLKFQYVSFLASYTTKFITQ